VTRRPLRTLDPTRSAAALDFADAPAEPLGAAGDGPALLRTIFDRAAAFMAFEQLGGADRALEMARDYALERHAFGRPIGSYQAVKHRLADMYIRNQIARSHAYYGAWALGAGGAEMGRAAAAARIAAADAYWYASKEAIEIFGGIGATWEADCHLFYRRAKQLSLAVGAPSLWKERLVAELEHATIS
jgi:alkylation response protein AidB-like acyl-CoA dehydrogenase